MKKSFINLFSAFTGIALCFAAVSCSDGSDTIENDTSVQTGGAAETTVGLPKGYKAKTVTFDVTTASTNAEDTVLLIKYDRSAAGAEELISITDADLTVKKNGTVIKTFDKVEFALDENGASFSRATTPISDKSDMKEYKVKLSIGQTVSANDTIEVSLSKCNVNLIGSAASSVKPTDVLFALIDKAEAVSYYKELSGTEYVPIFEKSAESASTGTSSSGTTSEGTSTNSGTSDSSETSNAIWTGSQVLGWSDNDGIVLAGTKFENKNFSGLKVTCTATEGGFKIAVCDPWEEIAFENVEGCNSDTDKKAIYPSTDGECVVTLTIPSANITGMKASGIKIMGDDKITITKIELVTE